MIVEDVVQMPAQDPQPDMFGGREPEPAFDTNQVVIQLTGELISAEVLTKAVGADQRELPVLCMDVRALTGFRQTIHAEQIFTEATRKLAEHKAASLKKGSRITLTTVLQDMCTFLPHVQSVQLNP